MEDFTLAEVIFHLSCLSDDDVEACKEICHWLCETIVLPKDLDTSFQSLTVAFAEASLARTCDANPKELTLPFTSVAPGYTRNAKYSPQMHHFGRVHRLHMDELQTLQQCLEECRQQKSCFPFAETLAKIATWVHSVREDMQATDSSRGPVARDRTLNSWSMRVSLLTTQGDVTNPWQKKACARVLLVVFLHVDRLFVIAACRVQVHEFSKT